MKNRSASRSLDRQILTLAWPALGALVAEPLFLLADAAIIGHLGTVPLAGLGVAGAVLHTALGLCVFLAYGTTAHVARRVGAGDRAGALTLGMDGLWLAVAVGVALTVAGEVLTGSLVGAFGGGPEVAAAATSYLRVAWLGSVPMLLVLAATGVLRGLHDTRTPLLVTAAASAANVVLNVVLVYGFDLGLAGSAWGTVIAQVGAAVALAGTVVRVARRDRARLTPDLNGVLEAAHSGGPLLLRTLTLRASLLVTAWSAAALGATAVATHQLAMTLWTFLAFTLDAVAIAAQTLVATSLGAGDVALTRRTTQRVLRMGIGCGLVTGALLAAASPLLGPLFTSDPEVRSALTSVLLVAAVFQPAAAVVFVLDGVLIGAGDGRYLAVGGALVLAAFAPAALATTLLPVAPGTALLLLWAVFGVVFIGGRTAVLVRRARGDAWLTPTRG